MNKLLIFVGIVALTALSGCYYDAEDELYPEVCDTSTLTFQADIEPLIANKCGVTGCHVTGGTGNGLFDSFQGVKNKADNGSLRNRVLVTKDMPPSGSITACELQLIEAWLDAGAPNN